MIQQVLAVWSLIPLPFLNPACTSGNFRFTYCWSLPWRVLSMTLLAREMSALLYLNILWHHPTSASVRPTPFLSYCAHLCMKLPLVSVIFLKRCLVFHILLFSSISLHCSLRKAFLSLISILWESGFSWVYLSFPLCLSLLFFSQLFVRPPQITILPCWISFSWGWFWSLPPEQHYKTPSIVLQALNQI